MLQRVQHDQGMPAYRKAAFAPVARSLRRPKNKQGSGLLKRTRENVRARAMAGPGLTTEPDGIFRRVDVH